MELKFLGLSHKEVEQASSNRTFMELKLQRYVHQRERAKF